MRSSRLVAAVAGLLVAVGMVFAASVPSLAAPRTGPVDSPTARSGDPTSSKGWDWNWNWRRDGNRGRNKTVLIPGADRFAPFALTINVGDSVTWRNNDEDDHTVTSVDAFTNTDHRGTNVVIEPDGTFTLTFRKAGTFLYRCRFHSNLDAFNQPIAPGPEGGIQDASGNFGTPMMGVITVLNKK
jgi:plastocyanin